MELRGLSIYNTNSLVDAKRHLDMVLDNHRHEVELYYILNNKTNEIIEECEKSEVEETIEFGF